jgi:transcriptional regulator with XRE-family HTH domain
MHGKPRQNNTGIISGNPAALKSFLIDRRGRVPPESVGLPSPSRRNRGLTRQHIAELLDVSPLWYALFESGTSGRRFSYAFLARLVAVLKLDEDDVESLFTLVVTTGHAAADLETAWYRRRLDDLTREIERCPCAVHDRAHVMVPRETQRDDAENQRKNAFASYAPTTQSTI